MEKHLQRWEEEGQAGTAHWGPQGQHWWHSLCSGSGPQGRDPSYLPQLLARTARAGVVVTAALQMGSGGDSTATKILSHQVLFP